MKLNLGASDRCFEGYLSVDIAEPADIICDLRLIWPWSTSSIEAIKAYDILEHLPDKIHTMNELWRVLVPGGKADIEIPTVRGVGAVCDPTHCSYWSLGDFEYYESGNYARFRFAQAYGIKAEFKIAEKPIPSMYKNKFGEEVWKAKIMLEAVK